MCLCEDASMLQWPEPKALGGVKSKKLPIFELAEAEINVGAELCKADGIKLSLNSRILAVGEGGRAVVRLLEEKATVSSGQAWRQPNLSIVHLGPDELSRHLLGDDFVGAINAAMEVRPQVVILDECLKHHNTAWAHAFSMVLSSDAFRAFGGAIVVLCSDETLPVSRLCPETWILLRDLGFGKSVQSIASLETYDVTDACSEEDAQLDSVSQSLLDQALAIEDEKASKDGNLKLWMDKCKDEPCRIKIFASVDADGQRSFRGFLCQEMIEGNGEFHIRFVYVPREYRGIGLGSRLMEWVLNSAKRLPPSECGWISLEAANEDLVAYYERFGFVDFGGEDDDGNTWMERKNESIIGE